MNKTIIQSLKEVMSDRPFFMLVAAVFASMVLFSVFALFSIDRVDIQIVTRYSSFGEAHFYKNAWWYLYGFVAFGVIAGAAHAAIMAKLRAYDRRDLGLMFGWFSLVVVVVAFAYAFEVFKVAFL